MKRKKGIVLIVAAVLIFAGFLSYEYAGKKEKKKEPEQSSVTGTAAELSEEKTVTESSPSVTPETIKNEDNPDDKEWQESIVMEINPDILTYMKVSEKDFRKQIKLFANSSGYTETCHVQDMGEVTVNFSEETITVPCYLSMGKQSMKVDVIYQYQKEKWRFVPW